MQLASNWDLWVKIIENRKIGKYPPEIFQETLSSTEGIFCEILVAKLSTVCVQKRHNSSRKASSSRRKDQRNVQNVLWQNNGSWIQRPHAPYKYMFMYSGELICFKDISTFLNSCQIFSCSINLLKTYIGTFHTFFPLGKADFFCTCFLRQPCSVFVRHNT